MSFTVALLCGDAPSPVSLATSVWCHVALFISLSPCIFYIRFYFPFHSVFFTASFFSVLFTHSVCVLMLSYFFPPLYLFLPIARPSIKYVTLFLAIFYPLPCHTLPHIPGPQKVRRTSRTPPLSF